METTVMKLIGERKNVYMFDCKDNNHYYLQSNEESKIELVLEKDGVIKSKFYSENIIDFKICKDDIIVNCESWTTIAILDFNLNLLNKKVGSLDELSFVCYERYEDYIRANQSHDVNGKRERKYSGIYSLKENRFLLECPKFEHSGSFAALTGSLYTRCNTEPGDVYIYDLSKTPISQLHFNVKESLGIGYTKNHMYYGGVYKDMVIISAEGYITLTNIHTGKLVSKCQCSVPQKNFVLVDNIIYCSLQLYLSRYDILEDNTVVERYCHILELCMTPHVHYNTIVKIVATKNKIWAINQSGSYPRLAEYDGETGEMNQSWNLNELYGMKEAEQILLHNNRLYINTFRRDLFIFEIEGE